MDLQSDKGKEEFRGWFVQLEELRTVYPNAPLLAPCATCSLKNKKEKIET